LLLITQFSAFVLLFPCECKSESPFLSSKSTLLFHVPDIPSR
jgi:hypothetical protein